MKRRLIIFASIGTVFLSGWFGHVAYSHNPHDDVQWQFVAAAERGDLAGVQRCFAQGACIDAVPVDNRGYVSGFPALLEAARSGRVDIVEWLLAHGANPDLSISDGAPLDAIEIHLSEVEKTLDLLKQHGAKNLYPEPHS